MNAALRLVDRLSWRLLRPLFKRGLRRLAAAERGVLPADPVPAAPPGNGLAVVIPERGTPDLLAECLASLRSALQGIAEPRQVVVMVNGVPRRPYRALQAAFPEVQWQFSRSALGFSGAVRRALAQVRQPWVYLLNSDMRLEPDALRLLLPWRAPHVFAVASQIEFVDRQRRREETGWTDLRLRDHRPEVFDVPPEDDCVRGNLYAGGGSSLFQTAHLVRYAAAARGYDPFYFEDVEWGIRAWRDGMLVLFCPQSRVHHHHRATVRRFYRPRQIDRIVARNLLLLQLRSLPLPPEPYVLLGQIRQLPLRTWCDLVLTSRLRDAAALRATLAAAPFGHGLLQTARLHRFMQPWPTATATSGVVVTTPFLPYPSRHGGAVRVAHLVAGLARHHWVVVVSDEASLLQPLAAVDTPGVAALFIVGGRPEVPTGGSERLARAANHAHAGMRSWLRLVRHALRPRVVQVEHVELAPLVEDRRADEVWALDLHDVTLGIDGDDAANAAERAWLARYDLALYCSPEDGRLLAGSVGPELLHIGNGIDLGRFTYVPSAGKSTVLFAGPFRYPPNRVGIERFLQEAWPGIRAAVATAELCILGGNGAPEYARGVAAFAQPGVKVHADQADTRPFLAACALTINPQHGIRGSSLKVVESLAAGRVCVTTRDGARGFSDGGFVGLVVVSDVGEMGRQIEALLRDESSRLARERPVPERLLPYDWRCGTERLARAYAWRCGGAAAAYDRLAELYDEDMGPRAMPGDVEFYLAQARAGSGPVLDLGAGTGRLSLPLVAAGLPVVAADRSRAMLRELQRKALLLDAGVRARLQVLVMDIEAPAVHGPFTTIVCGYSVLTYLQTAAAQLHLLRWARAALAPGGRFVCDVFVPQPEFVSGGADGWMQDYDRICADGSRLRRSKSIRQDRDSQRNTIARHYRRTSASGDLLEEFRTVETIRYLFQPELCAMLRQAGFATVHEQGDFAGQRFSSAARMMTFVAVAPD